MSVQHTPVAEVGIRSRSVLFDGPWLKAIYSVGRYRSGWGIHRVTSNPRDPRAGDWALWIATGIATKSAAIAAALSSIAKATEPT
jgi:hypothetical protein